MPCTVKTIFLLSLAALLSAAACVREPEPPEPEPSVPETVRDSIGLRLSFGVIEGALGRTARELEAGLGRVDIFIYEARDMQSLLLHRRVSGTDEVSLRLPLADIKIVAVANSPYGFNLKALARYDAMEQLEYDFVDDDPEHPIMSAQASLCPDTPSLYSCRMELMPLMCEVHLEELSCDIDSYDILEDTRVRLVGINRSARVLRFEEIIPSESISYGEWSHIGCDVGFYPVADAARLYCYPNDTPEDRLGVARSALEISCRIAGDECGYRLYLPPLPRASVTHIRLYVNGQEEFYYDCTSGSQSARLPGKTNR